MRILVTGGAGYVGFPLCEQLSRHGHTVIVVDDFSTTADRAERLATFAATRRVDITDRQACFEVFAAEQPEVVIHLAALHFIPECNRRPADAMRINVVGTQNVLDACAAVPSIARVLVTSSAAVYPISDEFMREVSPMGPTDIYGGTKAVNEWQAQRFVEATGRTAVVIRLYNVFGPGETNPHVIPEVIEQLRNGADTLGLGNVSPKRCYVYVDDVVDGFEAAATAPLQERFVVMNLGTREEASVEEVIGILSKWLKRPIRIASDESRRRASDRPFLRCDPSRIQALTGWSAKQSLDEGLRRLLVAERLL